MVDMFKFEKGDRVFLVWPVRTPHVTLDGDFYEVLGVTSGHIQVNGSVLWIPKWHFVKVLKEYVRPEEKPPVTEECDYDLTFYTIPPGYKWPEDYNWRDGDWTFGWQTYSKK